MEVILENETVLLVIIRTRRNRAPESYVAVPVSSLRSKMSRIFFAIQWWSGQPESLELGELKWNASLLQMTLTSAFKSVKGTLCCERSLNIDLRFYIELQR